MLLPIFQPYCSNFVPRLYVRASTGSHLVVSGFIEVVSLLCFLILVCSSSDTLSILPECSSPITRHTGSTPSHLIATLAARDFLRYSASSFIISVCSTSSPISNGYRSSQRSVPLHRESSASTICCSLPAMTARDFSCALESSC